MMQKEFYLINEAAKEVQVEAHVLRYWEEELGLPIKRNAKGHRLYSDEDVQRFIKVKKLKEEGLQLKAVKRLIKDIENIDENKRDDKVVNFQMKKDFDYMGKDKVSDIIAEINEEKMEGKKQDVTELPFRIEIKQAEATGEISDEQKIDMETKKELQIVENIQSREQDKREKAIRLQALLRHMINDSIQLQQQDMLKQIKDNISKEFDYQFRQFEELQIEREKKQIEREEQREQEQREREEKHYKKIDELLRLASIKGKRKKLS